MEQAAAAVGRDRVASLAVARAATEGCPDSQSLGAMGEVMWGAAAMKVAVDSAVVVRAVERVAAARVGVARVAAAREVAVKEVEGTAAREVVVKKAEGKAGRSGMGQNQMDIHD